MKINNGVTVPMRYSTWTIQQTARNCAEQFSLLSPREKCQSKNGMVEILSFCVCKPPIEGKTLNLLTVIDWRSVRPAAICL
jgi:hypothetical protein